MTQTTTDYLFPATTAVPDRSYSVAVTSGLGKFDDHLSQASSFAGSGSQSFGGGTQRTDSSTRDDNNSKRNSTSSRSDTGDSSSTQTSRPDERDSRDAASAAGSSEHSRSDDRDRDKSDDTTAAETAGANQPPKSNTKPADSKNEDSEKSETSEALKAAAANKKTAGLNGKNGSDATGEAQGDAGGPALDAQHADAAAMLAAKVAADETKVKDNAEAVTAADSKARQQKAANNSGGKVKAKSDASVPEAGGAKDAAIHATATSETATEAAANEQAKADAAAAVADKTAPKCGSQTDHTQNSDSKDSRADSLPGSRNDAGAATTKVDAAQLAAVAANVPDTSPKASSKGKDGDAATKPIEAKGESPAVAFARMSRASNSDASSTATGSNDTPQVNPSRFIGRVAKAFQTAHDRGGTLQLRLSPPELGALRIELHVKDGVMSASLQTENTNTRKLLLDHLPALRDRLADQNIRVDRFDVDVRQDGAGGQADARGWQQQHSQHQPDRSPVRRPVQTQPNLSTAAAPERIASVPATNDAGLNLII